MSTLLGCSESAAPDSEKVVQVYYINNDETGILFENYEVKADMDDTTAVIEELLDRMQTMPEKLEYEAPIYGPIKLLSYSYNTGLLTLNFDSSYVETDSTIEILDRAAMVRTLTQIPDVENVAFMIAGNPLTDVNGNIIGNMSADSFVYNAGNEINTYEKVELVLYFATEDGKKLVPVYRSVVYNSNIPMQRLAVEQILKGPNTDVAFPTLNSQTKINSVSVRDGVCYVDFDNNFLIQPHAVTPDVAIYSLVNTLCAITDTNKVQISVGGSSDVIFMETVSLGTVFERNLDIVE
ncbi:GerMN domain-containing protein [Butyrivibrio sp. WCD3002]|uniref:GerMN domain-containing protein n=1 Tax=Butyrivibrio sp. WCD3002 TaxID=1280676 RepID=UPI0018C95440|nr:GerMN domain-containing protein [Butyrivibrio sp. WCD3002]